MEKGLIYLVAAVLLFAGAFAQGETGLAPEAIDSPPHKLK